MNEPLQVPLRILVRGPSMVGFASDMPPGRTTFSRVIENALLAQGKPAQVQTVTRASETTAMVLQTWEESVTGFYPDVIVIVAGMYETMHLFLPRRYERFSTDRLRKLDRPIRNKLRKYLVWSTWKALINLQVAIDSRATRALHRRPRNVRRDLVAYIRNARKFGEPLVLIVELLPPSSRSRRWFPGMTRRIPLMNQYLSTVPDEFEGNGVEFVRVLPLAEKFDPDLDVVIPDGIHYASGFHQMVGEHIAERIAAWSSAEGRPINSTRR